MVRLYTSFIVVDTRVYFLGLSSSETSSMNENRQTIDRTPTEEVSWISTVITTFTSLFLCLLDTDSHVESIAILEDEGR